MTTSNRSTIDSFITRDTRLKVPSWRFNYAVICHWIFILENISDSFNSELVMDLFDFSNDFNFPIICHLEKIEFIRSSPLSSELSRLFNLAHRRRLKSVAKKWEEKMLFSFMKNLPRRGKVWEKSRKILSPTHHEMEYDRKLLLSSHFHIDFDFIFHIFVIKCFTTEQWERWMEEAEREFESLITSEQVK